MDRQMECSLAEEALSGLEKKKITMLLFWCLFISHDFLLHFGGGFFLSFFIFGFCLFVFAFLFSGLVMFLCKKVSIKKILNLFKNIIQYLWKRCLLTVSI